MKQHADHHRNNNSNHVAGEFSGRQKSIAAFADHRPAAIRQMKLQEMAGKSDRIKRGTALQEIMDNSHRITDNMRSEADIHNDIAKNNQSVSTQPLQLKIHVKSGEKIDGVKPATDAPKLKAIADSPKIFLVQSMTDIEKMKRKEDVPVLGPQKHLIGERHSISRFKDVVKDWGWGAEMLIETYSEHEKLKNPSQDKKKQTTVTPGVYDEHFMWAKSKGLENTVVKGLTNMVNAQIYSQMAYQLALNNQDPAKFGETDKQQLKAACADFWQHCNLALNVAKALEIYLRDSTESRGWGWIGEYWAGHQLIEHTVTKILLTEMAAGLDSIAAQYEDINTFHLNPGAIKKYNAHINSLVPVLQQLIVAFDAGINPGELQRDSEAAKKSGKIEVLNPYREKYMISNINAASIPALVKLGEQHVVNIAKTLPKDAAPYLDYAAFLDKNRAENVI